MAKSTSSEKTPFYEVVFRGKPKVVRAFLTGLLMGAGRHDKASVFYNFLEGVKHEGKAEKLKEMVGIRATDCHVIVDADTSTLIKKRTREIVTETGLEIASHRRIRSAAMEFSYQAFAERYHDEILGLLDKLPDGVRLQGFKKSVRKDPAAKGPEMYTAVHHYEATGKGRLTGRIDLLIAAKRDFEDYPLIKAEEIILKVS